MAAVQINLREPVYYDPIGPNAPIEFYLPGTAESVAHGHTVVLINYSEATEEITITAKDGDTILDPDDLTAKTTIVIRAQKNITLQRFNTEWRLMDIAPLRPMNFRGVQNTELIYNRNDVVTRDAWTMIANKATQDLASPLPAGLSEWRSGFGDTPPWSNPTATEIVYFTGQRYTFTESYFITAYRFWEPSILLDTFYELWLVLNPTTAPSARILLPRSNGTIEDNWITIPVGREIAPAGSEADLVLVTSKETGGGTWAAEWNYSRSNAAPAAGEANHSNNGNTIRFHNTDYNSGDQSTNLALMNIGDTIFGAGMLWTIIGITVNASDYAFDVSPSSNGTVGVTNFTFSYYTPSPIEYVEVVNHYSADAEVTGISTNDYRGGLWTPNQNAYGVDIEVTPATVSPDWDFVAYSG